MGMLQPTKAGQDLHLKPFDMVIGGTIRWAQGFLPQPALSHLPLEQLLLQFFDYQVSKKKILFSMPRNQSIFMQESIVA